MQVLGPTREKILMEVQVAAKGIVELEFVTGLGVLATSSLLEEMVAEGLLMKKSDGFRVLYLASRHE